MRRRRDSPGGGACGRAGGWLSGGRRPAGARFAARGMTFLEVVFATALFAIVASSILGVFSFTVSAANREQKLLACAEVANRLIMAYMDDPSLLPDPNKTVEYGPAEGPLTFRWDYREDPVALVEPRGDARQRVRESPLRMDRFVQVTVKVWLAEDSGGSRWAGDGTPQIVLTRMYDPTYLRNPDSFMRQLESGRGIDKLMQALQGKSQLRQGETGATRGRVDRSSRAGGVSPREAFNRSSGTRSTR